MNRESSKDYSKRHKKCSKSAQNYILENTFKAKIQCLYLDVSFLQFESLLNKKNEIVLEKLQKNAIYKVK